MSVLFLPSYRYHHDQIGSTRLITDSTGISQATYTYDPYGSLASSTGTIVNPFRFTGQYQDSSSNESGYYYLRARYYDPTTAQLLSVDPAYSATSQTYAYASDNPLNVTDPSGLCSGIFDCAKAAGQWASNKMQEGTSYVSSQVEQTKSWFAHHVSFTPPHYIGAQAIAGYVLGAYGAFELGYTLLRFGTALAGFGAAAGQPELIVLGVAMDVLGLAAIGLGVAFLLMAAGVLNVHFGESASAQRNDSGALQNGCWMPSSV